MYLHSPQTRGCQPSCEVRALLKLERLERGMSLELAASQIGMTPDAFRQMEHGTGRASHKYETVRLWAALFDYEIDLQIRKRD